MASDPYLGKLLQDLLAGGDVTFQGADAFLVNNGAGASEAVQLLTKQMGELVESTDKQTTTIPKTSQSSTQGVAGGVLSTLAGDPGKSSGNFLMKGLTLAPLIDGLLGLFRRESSAEVAAPVRFSLPAPIRTEAALSPDGQTISIDRGAGDRIRPLRHPENPTSQFTNGSLGTQTRGTSSQNITVQVNAMDSRSFMDHSEDIARAVRDAMLHSHSLNDVVNDL